MVTRYRLGGQYRLGDGPVCKICNICKGPVIPFRVKRSGADFLFIEVCIAIAELEQAFP